jgi:hypothetical protein
MMRLTAALCIGGVCLVLLLSGTGASGQDKDKKEPDKKETTTSKKGLLPTGWKKLGLSEDQVQKIGSIRSQYKVKIDEVKNQIKKLKADEDKLKIDEHRELVQLLSESQRNKLIAMIAEKAGLSPPTDKGSEVKKDKQ